MSAAAAGENGVVAVKLQRWRGKYNHFPWWDSVAVRHESYDVRLCIISPDDMAYLLDRDLHPTMIYGVPAYVSLNEADDKVTFYPFPDRDYELVRVG